MVSRYRFPMSAPQDPRDPQPGYPNQGGPPQQEGYPPQGGYPAGSTQQYGEPYPGRQQVKRPGVLVVSVVLWVLTGLLMLLSGVAVALFGSANNELIQRQIDQAMARSGVQGQLDPAVVQQAAVATGIVLAVFGGLLVLLALLMLGRQNWARIVLTVLGVIALVLLLGTVIGSLVVLVAIVLHFLPAVNAWFKSRPHPA